MRLLSVPSSSGHRFQLQAGEPRGGHGQTFSPLFIGAQVSTAVRLSWARTARAISVPSSSGHRFQPSGHRSALHHRQPFQSPLHRGTGFNPGNPDGVVVAGQISVPSSSGHRFQHVHAGALRDSAVFPFSPLFIGAQVSTPSVPLGAGLDVGLSVPSSSGHRFQRVSAAPRTHTFDNFQSPLHRGTGFNCDSRDAIAALSMIFQSPLHRGTGFNHQALQAPACSARLSVPSSSGHRFQRGIAGNLAERFCCFQSPLHRGTGFN